MKIVVMKLARPPFQTAAQERARVVRPYQGIAKIEDEMIFCGSVSCKYQIQRRFVPRFWRKGQSPGAAQPGSKQGRRSFSGIFRDAIAVDVAAAGHEQV